MHRLQFELQTEESTSLDEKNLDLDGQKLVFVGLFLINVTKGGSQLLHELKSTKQQQKKT